MQPKRGKIIDRMSECDLFSAQQLAERAGISETTARKVMRGESVIMKVATKVSIALGVAPTDLFDLEGDR